MIYDYFEFKPFENNNRNVEAHRLADCEEARDQLLRVFLKDDSCIAIFRFGEVALPEGLREELAALVGREIAVLRLESRYYVRDVVEECITQHIDPVVWQRELEIERSEKMGLSGLLGAV